MDEMEKRIVIEQLCNSIRENIAKIKENITSLEAIKEEYIQRKKDFMEAVETLYEANKYYEEAKRECEESLICNAGKRAKTSFETTISEINKQITRFETETIPKITNTISQIEIKIEYFQSNINYVSQMSNTGEIEKMEVLELEEHLRNTARLLEEINTYYDMV